MLGAQQGNAFFLQRYCYWYTAKPFSPSEGHFPDTSAQPLLVHELFFFFHYFLKLKR